MTAGGQTGRLGWRPFGAAGPFAEPELRAWLPERRGPGYGSSGRVDGRRRRGDRRVCGPARAVVQPLAEESLVMMMSTRPPGRTTVGKMRTLADSASR